MDRDVRAADEYYRAHILDKSPSREELQRFETLVRFCNRDMAGFRMTKNDWSDFLAKTTSGVSAIAAVLPLAALTQGVAQPWAHALMVAAAAGLVQGGVQFAIKAKLKGDGFGREEKLRDLAQTALCAGSFYITKFLPFSLLRRPIDFGTKIGIKTIVRLGEAGDADRTPAHALTLRDLKRVLDDASGVEPAEAPAEPLSEHADGTRGVCSLESHDVRFEKCLRRLLA